MSRIARLLLVLPLLAPPLLAAEPRFESVRPSADGSSYDAVLTGNAVAGWKHPNYAGGDLKALIEKLDYIRSLGANAIWLSPVLPSSTSHGYDVKNYYAIADQWGAAGDRAASLELFRSLVKRAHEAGIRVILDIPLNHASKLYELPESDPGDLKPRATGPIQPTEKLWDSWRSVYRYRNFESVPTRRFLSECWADDQGPDRNASEIAAHTREVPGKGPQFDSLLDFPMQSTLKSALGESTFAPVPDSRKIRWHLPALSTSILAPQAGTE